MAFQPRTLRLSDLSLPQDNTAQTLAGLGQTLMQNYDAGRKQLLENEKMDAERQAAAIAAQSILGGQTQQPLANLGQMPPQQTQQQPQLPAFAQMQGAPQGKGLQSLIQNESGGRWDAQNNVMGAGGKSGHFGRLQFGQARLEDAMNAGVLPQGTTPQQFMSNPETQKAVEDWHFKDNWNKATQMGLASYVGQNVAGIPITQQGILAGAHLGGIGGVAKFLQTGGRYNPADANGTRISDYVAKHGGADMPEQGAQQAQFAVPQQAQQPAQQGNSAADMYEKRAQQFARAFEASGSKNVTLAKLAQEAQVKAIELRQKETYGFQTVGDQLVRTDPRTGQAMAIMQKPMNQLDEDLKRAQIEKTKAEAAGKLVANTSVNVNNAPEKAYDTEVGKSYAKTFTEIQDAGRAAPSSISTLKKAENIVNSPEFYSGTQSERVLGAKRLFDSMGFSTGSAASMEEFSKLAKEAVINKLGGSLGSGVSNADVAFMGGSAFNLDNTPEGNKRVINNMIKLEEHKAKIANFTRDYVKRNGRIDVNFDSELRDWAEKNPIFQEARKGGGMNVTPDADGWYTDPSGIKIKQVNKAK